MPKIEIKGKKQTPWKIEEEVVGCEEEEKEKEKEPWRQKEEKKKRNDGKKRGRGDAWTQGMSKFYWGLIELI